MSIVQTALTKLFAPTMGPLLDRITALEGRPGLSDADREVLAKAAALVAEFEALAEGSVQLQLVENAEGSITVTDVTP